MPTTAGNHYVTLPTLLLALVACNGQISQPSPSAESDPELSSGPTPTDPALFFGELGCVVVEGPPVTGTIAARRGDGHFVQLNCRGVRAELLAAALGEYAAFGRRTSGQARAMAFAWDLVRSDYLCEPTSVTVVIDGGPGRMVERLFPDGSVETYWVVGVTRLTFYGVGNCQWVDVYQGTPNGDPEFDPPPLPPPPADSTIRFFFDPAGLPMEPPDCSPASQLRPQIHAWCNGHIPDPLLEMPLILQAISAIRSRGGQCIPFANTLEAVLPDLRLFDQENYPPVSGRQMMGVSPTGGGAEGWIALSRHWVSRYGRMSSPLITTVYGFTFRFTLEDALAHEADHLLGGEGHIGPNDEPVFSPLQQLCSPFGIQWSGPA